MSLSTKEEYIAQCMTTGKTREECENLWNQAQSSTDQDNKEEWIKQCVAGGKTHEECETAWSESHQPTGDYATLVREYEMLKVKNRQLQDALRESVAIIKAVNTERDAITDARKYELALEIEQETDSKVKHRDLMKESLKDLNIMKKAMDLARPKDFVSVQALLAKDQAKKTPQLTVGSYNPETKKWEGGT